MSMSVGGGGGLTNEPNVTPMSVMVMKSAYGLE